MRFLRRVSTRSFLILAVIWGTTFLQGYNSRGEAEILKEEFDIYEDFNVKLFAEMAEAQDAARL